MNKTPTQLNFLGCQALTCTSTTWMESQQPLIFFEPSPAFLMRMTPAKPWSRSHRYTDETPPSKYLQHMYLYVLDGLTRYTHFLAKTKVMKILSEMLQKCVNNGANEKEQVRSCVTVLPTWATEVSGDYVFFFFFKLSVGEYSQVPVLVEGIVGLHLQLPQTGRGHRTIIDGGLVLITPGRS